MDEFDVRAKTTEMGKLETVKEALRSKLQQYGVLSDE